MQRLAACLLSTAAPRRGRLPAGRSAGSGELAFAKHSRLDWKQKGPASITLNQSGRCIVGPCRPGLMPPRVSPQHTAGRRPDGPEADSLFFYRAWLRYLSFPPAPLCAPSCVCRGGWLPACEAGHQLAVIIAFAFSLFPYWPCQTLGRALALDKSCQRKHAGVG